MTGFIELRNLRIYARHGVNKQEFVTGNDFEVNISLQYNFIDAAISDDINLTINYAELTDIVKQTMATPRLLLETVALDIQRAVTSKWHNIVSGRIEIIKPHPPISAPTPQAAIILCW